MTLRQLADRNRDDWRGGLTTVEQACRAAPVARLRTRLVWLDELTGGGFVQGAVYLVHGEPGAGKSTMLAQAAGSISGAVYVSAEESVGQVGHRFKRLGLESFLIESKDVESSLRDAAGSRFVVLDSVQALSGDVVENTEYAVAFARDHRMAIALVCHQTKGGAHRGPTTIEHYVDASLRVVRGPPRLVLAEKNRFGAAGLGLPVTMTDKGLIGN